MITLQMTDGVSELSIANVEAYLEKTGWRKGNQINPKLIPYEGPLDIHGNPLIAVLPASRAYSDANRRLNEVIRSIASVEFRSPESVIEDIKTSGVRRVLSARAHLKSASRPRPRKQPAAAKPAAT